MLTYFYKNGAILSAGNYKTQAGKVIGDPGISVNNNFSNIYVYHNLENGYIDEGQNFLSLCNIIMKQQEKKILIVL